MNHGVNLNRPKVSGKAVKKLASVVLLSSVIIANITSGPTNAEPEVASHSNQNTPQSQTQEGETTTAETVGEVEPFQYYPEYQEYPYPADDPTINLPNPDLRPRSAFRSIVNMPFTCGSGNFTFITNTGAMSQVDGEGNTNKVFPAMPTHFRTYTLSSSTRSGYTSIVGTGLKMSYDEYIYWTQQLGASGGLLQWRDGYVYGSGNITYKPNTTVNSLGISKHGEYAYALATHASGRHVSLYRYDINGWSETPVQFFEVNFFATVGAIDLFTGNYYFGGYYDRGSDPQIFRIYRYDVKTQQVALAADIPMKFISRAPNGDMAFDSLGNLSIVRSDSIGGGLYKPTLYTINLESLRKAESAGGAQIHEAVITDNIGSSPVAMSGIAFDDDGEVYMSGGFSVVKYNLITQERRALKNVEATASTTDIATCAEPPTIRIKKALPEGYAPDDNVHSFDLKLLSPRGEDSIEYGSGTITGSENSDAKIVEAEIAAQTVGPFVVPANAKYNLTEVPKSGTYFPQWSCEDQNGLDLAVKNLTKPGEVQVHIPEWVEVTGDTGTRKERAHVTCTVKNDSRPFGYLKFTKKIRGVDGNLATVDTPKNAWPFEAKLAGGTIKNEGLAQFQTGNTGEADKTGVGEAQLDFSYINDYRNGATVEFGEKPEAMLHSTADAFQNYPDYTFVPGTAENNLGSYCEYTPYFRVSETFPLTQPYTTISELTAGKYTVFKPGDKLACTYINKQVGSITLKTYDADASTATNKVPLPGTVYELWSSVDTSFDSNTDTKLGELTADANGVIKWTELDLDKHYFIREKSHPDEYHNVPVAGKPTDYLMSIDLTADEAPRTSNPHVVREVDYYRNRYVIKWRKTDDENQNRILTGSAWRLTESTLNTTVDLPDCASANSCAGEDRDGEAGVFQTKPLPWGTYKLEETEVPIGYYGNMPVEIKINKDGTIALRNLQGDSSLVTAPLYGTPVTGTVRASDSAGVTRDYTMFTFDIGNKPNRNKVLTWEKIDGLNDKHLSGSTWKLTTPDGEVEIADCVGSCPATTVSNTFPATVIYRDNDPAEGKFRVEKLKAGTYGLQEYTAPSGYVLKKTAETPIEHTDNENVKSFGRIANNPITIPSLPLTGGTSSDAFIIAASLVFAMAVGTGVQAYRRRKA